MNCARTLAYVAGVALAAASALAPSSIYAQANVTGQWNRLPYLPMVPIHNVYLPNGKLMFFGKNSTQTLWDPITGAVSNLPSPGYDLFCSAHTYLNDSTVLVPGGHIADYVGLAKTSLYNPATNSWSAAPDMNAGRWYPTATTLPNGDALVLAGQIDTTVGMNTLPQVYQKATNTWRNLTTAQLYQPMYPMMFLAPNGRVIDVGPSPFTRWLDTSGTGSWANITNRTTGWRDYGSAVMFDTGKIMIAGGGDPPIKSVEILDLNKSPLEWRFLQSMDIARRHLNLTLLPDGQVFANGGTYGPGHNNENTVIFSSEMWSPETELWTTMASATVPRIYHSSSVLLPDGRVVTTGGDSYPEIEVFSPPYLFKGARPTMSAVPAQIQYGQSFAVQSPESANIVKATLIRLTAVTHAFNMNQRLNKLSFAAAGAGSVLVTPPANANLAPPGLYMLFLINAAGVPSVGSIVQLGRS